MTLPVAGCIGPRSYRTMRDAWDAIQTDRWCGDRVPYRCSVCKYWHLSGAELRDGRHQVRVVEAA